MSTENQKIPCGGFRIGDGLAMDDDTLKSLGGTYVKVGVSRGVISLWDDSPLKDYWEIYQAGTPVNLIAQIGSVWYLFYCIDKKTKIVFQCLTVSNSKLNVEEISVDSDNNWTDTYNTYTLTT